MADSTNKKFKLDGEHKEYVINKLALHCGVTEIAESLKEEFGIDITPPGIAYYKREWEKEWRKQREYFNKHIAEIEPFADKSLRVQKRGDLIRNIVDKGLWYTIKTAFGEHNKGNHGAINDLLDSIHKELEPNKHAWTDPSGEHAAEVVVILPAVIGPDGKPMIKKVKKEDDAEPDK